MADPFTPESDRPPWHSRIEHYTPDGPLGRLLFTVVAGSVGVGAILLGVFSLVTFGALGVLGGLLLGSVGLVACLLAVVVLWPVYLSLIGNVESAREYADAVAGALDERTDGTDPFEILQRRYAAGEISSAEFERRLDNLVAVEADAGQGGERSDRRPAQSDGIRETNRN